MKRPRIHMATNAQGDAEISIFGPISSFAFWGDEVSAKMVQEALDQAAGAPRIRLLLNSPGGDVFEGQAIYNLLARVRDKLTVEVIGLAASAASVIALAGHELVMGEGSYFMIHEPWGVTVGPADEHLQTAALLEKMTGSFADLYTAHSELLRDEALEAMKAETWYTAEEAVEAGFASSVGEGSDIAAASLDTVRFQYKHAPNGLGVTAASTDREVPRTVRSFEQFLRDGGFSNTKAKTIAALSSPEFDPRDSGDSGAAEGQESSGMEPTAEDGDLMLRSRSQETAIAIIGRKP